jgi:hypothetical protein
VGGPAWVHGVIDIPEIDAHENGLRSDEKVDGLPGKIRAEFPIALCPPAFIPPCSDQYGSPREFGGRLAKNNRAVRLHLPIQNDPGNSSDPVERNLAQVRSVAVTVKRTIKIGSDVADHVHLSKIKLSPILIPCPRGLVVHEGTNLRSRKAWIGHHAIFDKMVQLDELHHSILP